MKELLKFYAVFIALEIVAGIVLYAALILIFK